MNVRTIPELLRALSRADILDPEQQQELRTLSVRYQEPHALARALLERGWLTPFQVNQLLQGNAHDLRRGAYLLLERLGKGGMGQVYKARHRQLGRIVALKVIHKEQTANPLAIRRFCREIQAMGQLAHPNIVMAFDAGGEAGQHFVTMEYVTGVDLGQLVERRGPLPIWDACDTIRQAARGLQHAHEKGFIHRDIKPSNLLRAEPGGVVKLLDLGLARLSAEEREPVAPADATPRPLHTMLTQAGRIVGTPDFMAPEQARDSHQVDIRADLYSLGCTFYFLLTARMPFPGGTALEKLLRHNSETPRPVEQVRPQIPPAVAAVVRRLMAKQPAERYQTPAELVGVLDAILLGAAPVAQVVLPVATALPVLGDTAVDRSLPAVPNARANATAPRRAWRGRRGVIVAGVLAAVALLLILTLRLAHTPHHDDLSEARGEDNPPAPWTKRLSNSVGMQLVLIPAGRFTMGSPDSEAQRGDDEGPIHEVQISRPFYLGTCEVTQNEYERVMENNPAHFNGGNGGSLRHPVEQVSWADAVAFCQRLSDRPIEQREGRVYRLPTEAEWEYACRAGRNETFACGASLGSFQANFDGNNPYGDDVDAGAYRERTLKVGSFPATPWGLHDLHGNVGEWCADFYGDTYYADAPRHDPHGPEQGERRVWRGGAWDSPGQDCRSAARFSAAPDHRSPRIGFRAVMVPGH